MHHHDPQFTNTLELVEHVHGLTAEQADAILRTIPDECRLTAPAAIRLLSGREPTAHDHLTADRHELRLLKGDEGALVQLLSAHWRMGVMGWMTAEEGAQVAAELTADAARLQVAGRAEVRDGWLVFAGGRHGEQLLLLSATSPIRARKHFPGYLEACPPVRPATLLGRLGAQLGAQLDLIGWRTSKRGQR